MDRIEFINKITEDSHIGPTNTIIRFFDHIMGIYNIINYTIQSNIDIKDVSISNNLEIFISIILDNTDIQHIYPILAEHYRTISMYGKIINLNYIKNNNEILISSMQ